MCIIIHLFFSLSLFFCAWNDDRVWASHCPPFRKEVVFRVIPRESLKTCRRHFRDEPAYNRPWRDLLIGSGLRNKWGSRETREQREMMSPPRTSHRIYQAQGPPVRTRIAGQRNSQHRAAKKEKKSTDGGSISSLSNISEYSRLAAIYYLPSVATRITFARKPFSFFVIQRCVCHDWQLKLMLIVAH